MPDRKRKAEPAQGEHAPKICAACGRTVEYRKRWARNWDDVRFCSDSCRGARPGADEAELEAAILRLLAERGAGKTICPSEAARAVAAARGQSTGQEAERTIWEPLMEPARRAARRLVAAGQLDILQHGHPVDGSTAKGPIRLRRR